MATPLVVSEVSKSFTMHLRDGIKLPVVSDVSFSVASGECVVLGGPSGIGKSSLLKMIYGNYAVDSGQILVKHQDRLVDLATTDPRTIIEVRRHTLGYVSQFLRTVPRVAAIDVVAEPLVARGTKADVARQKAAELLAKLNLPEALWQLPPPPSPAASSSASTSPAASSPIIQSCCSTSRPPRSMPRTAPSSSR